MQMEISQNGIFNDITYLYRVNVNANIAIGECLRDLRMSSELTQDDIARTLNKPQSYVSKIETGERSLQLNELFDYSRALKLAPVDVVGSIEYALMKLD